MILGIAARLIHFFLSSMTTEDPGMSVDMQEGGRRRRRPGEAEGPRQEGLIAENPLLRGAGQGSRRVRLDKPSLENC